MEADIFWAKGQWPLNGYLTHEKPISHPHGFHQFYFLTYLWITDWSLVALKLAAETPLRRFRRLAKNVSSICRINASNLTGYFFIAQPRDILQYQVYHLVAPGKVSHSVTYSNFSLLLHPSSVKSLVTIGGGPSGPGIVANFLSLPFISQVISSLSSQPLWM